MESDPREPLLPGAGKSSLAEECSGSGSGADISETSRITARRSPPPPPPPPPRPLLGLGITKKRAIFSSSSPSLPSLPDNGIAKSPSAFLSSPSLDLGGVSDSDLEAAGRAKQQSPPASSSSNGDANKNTDGDTSPVPRTPPPSLFQNREDPEGLGNGTSASSSSSVPWWNLFCRLRRRAPPHLPVYAPRGSTRLDRVRKSVQELRLRGARLDSVGVERVIAIYGFSLFGSLSLLPYTIDRIKDFTTVNKSIVVFTFDVIWVLASVGVLSRLQGKSDLEQAFCRFTGRLGVVGLAMLVALHVWWTLPADNPYCTAGFYGLVFLALGLHLFSWVWSFLVGEDRIEDRASPDVQD